MDNAAFKKAMKNVRKHRDIKLVKIKARKIYSVSKPNYNTTKKFSENLLAIEMRKKIQVVLNKPVLLALSIIE